MPTRKNIPKSPPTSRQLDAQARKITEQIVEADRAGLNYISPLIDGEISLSDLFDKQFPAAVRRRVYQQLELEEQMREAPHTRP